MIRVYFESNAGGLELVATFKSEEIFMACESTLDELLVIEQRMIVTETIDEHEAIIMETRYDSINN